MVVGQVAPGAPTSCASSFDFLQASTPDNSYAMPATGTITSWTHRAQANVGQTPTLKIYRKVADPATYRVVGHDGPEPIPSGATRTFPAAIRVQAGDVLGITGAGGANIGCSFSGPGTDAYRSGNLTDDAFGDFTLAGSSARLNVSAVLDPDNSFTVTRPTLNKKLGAAALGVTVPNPGLLTASGRGVRVTGATSVPAGSTPLGIRATGKKRRTLNSTGKVKLSVSIAYTPTGGDPSSQSVKVTLKRK